MTEVVAVSSQLVCHSPLIVGVAVVHKGLKVLNVVVVAIQLELDNLWGTIRDLEIVQLKVHVVVQTDSFKLVREVIVIGNRKQALHCREGGNKTHHCIHPG
jgi:hypothetical protein